MMAAQSPSRFNLKFVMVLRVRDRRIMTNGPRVCGCWLAKLQTWNSDVEKLQRLLSQTVRLRVRVTVIGSHGHRRARPRCASLALVLQCCRGMTCWRIIIPPAAGPSDGGLPGPPGPVTAAWPRAAVTGSAAAPVALRLAS